MTRSNISATGIHRKLSVTIRHVLGTSIPLGRLPPRPIANVNTLGNVTPTHSSTVQSRPPISPFASRQSIAQSMRAPLSSKTATASTFACNTASASALSMFTATSRHTDSPRLLWTLARSVTRFRESGLAPASISRFTPDASPASTASISCAFKGEAMGRCVLGNGCCVNDTTPVKNG
ncbi:hypothetical protein M427DRAFT_57348 [Gonapodya prolifera JEL478]|uniref:Uncharacterized protein n=1 Tax=Gonapodya prolifera (strain JEL478) TaxID=1344416 RepID=A0A139AD35_GONPJ|nr:hypothetical protein M427DRAFT_57348 [Gonapodya prolifera JEL478]|eukprot:KXS14687.1 hypothetical protein M427DRAFT_57348 [Gonapodya prolifera JEL478]